MPELAPIALRPPEVAARIVAGHWEGDLIRGAGDRSAVGTLFERTGRYVMRVRLQGLSAEHILLGFSHRLRTVPPEPRRTLTSNQGSEMALHKTLARRLRMDIFFCDAYKPWQRGSNENANGIIRRYRPKGIDLAPFTAHDLSQQERVLSMTPRKPRQCAAAQEGLPRIELDAVTGVSPRARIDPGFEDASTRA